VLGSIRLVLGGIRLVLASIRLVLASIRLVLGSIRSLLCLLVCYSNSFRLWRFDPIPSHGPPLRGFAITLIGHTTLGRNRLEE